MAVADAFVAVHSVLIETELTFGPPGQPDWLLGNTLTRGDCRLCIVDFARTTSKHALCYSLDGEGFSCTEGVVRCMRCIELGALIHETDVFGVTI